MRLGEKLRRAGVAGGGKHPVAGQVGPEGFLAANKQSPPPSRKAQDLGHVGLRRLSLPWASSAQASPASGSMVQRRLELAKEVERLRVAGLGCGKVALVPVEAAQGLVCPALTLHAHPSRGRCCKACRASSHAPATSPREPAMSAR